MIITIIIFHYYHHHCFKYVLCGHSERRTLFKDKDDGINKKIKKVRQHKPN